MRVHRPIRLAVMVALAAGSIVSIALAADEPAKPATATPSTPADGGSLAGPRVQSEARKLTLVEREMDGTIKRISGAPAEAAVRLMELDEAARAKVNTILTERAALMDQLVSTHLRQLVELAGARDAGKTEDAKRIFREIWNDAAELKKRGTTGQDLARVLTEAQSAELRRLTDEYMQALITEELSASPDEGKAAKMAIVSKITVKIIGDEIRSAYDRVVGQRVRELDRLLLKIQATPEQESTIRRITGDLFQATYGRPTDAQRATMFTQIWQVLTPEQRKIVQDEIRGSKPGQP